jgi:hypothetical protein
MGFDACMSVDQELTTSGVLCIEEIYGVVGSGSWEDEGQGDGGDDDSEAESKRVRNFTEAVCAFESMRAQDITKRDQVKIVNIEILFSLKRKGNTKQMRINDF